MGNIVVVGPRGSGKTTYLAGLAYWPERKMAGSKRSRFYVEPFNADAKQLAEMAEQILLEGSSFEPSVVKEDLAVYNLVVKVSRRLREPEFVHLAVRDYPGEIFENLAAGLPEGSIQEELMDDCLMRENRGCLILLTEWRKGIDQFYRKVMQVFIEMMDQRDRLSDLRLAVVMSKCERGELWPGRLDPETDLFEVHLRETCQTLRQSTINQKNIRFYALSTFGVLGQTDPRPNRVDDETEGQNMSVLRDPNCWTPYNLIPPIYWLSTGKTIGGKL